MNKFKTDLLLERLIVVTCVAMSMQCCAKPHVNLPNSYKLEGYGNHIMLKSPDGVTLLKNPVTQFCVSNPYVYGWIDIPNFGYFFLDTSSGKLVTLEKWQELNKVTDGLKLPRFNMKTSYTFWDITSGHKTANW